MRPNDIARAWLGERPLSLVVCGAPEVGRLLLDDRVNVFSARTVAELAQIRTSVALHVAVIAEKPWAGGDALAIARAIRMDGLGTVLLTRSHGIAQQWLRERIVVELTTPDFYPKLIESVWFACFETELVRRSFDPSAPPAPAAPRPRYVVTPAGGIEPSKSTMTSLFGDLDLRATVPVVLEAPPLQAPPAPNAVVRRSESRTVELATSESVLLAMREEAAQMQRPRRRLGTLLVLSAIFVAAMAMILGVRWG